ncbi:MAG: Crp/Fnr family transcriptional regulator [Chitinophagales bacterium]
MRTLYSNNISEHFSEKSYHFKKRNYIYLPENIVQKIFFIHKGIIRIGYYNENSENITKAILFQGDIFGVLRLFHQEATYNYAEVMSSNAEIASMSQADFFQKINTDESFNLFVLQTISYRLIQLERRWALLSSMPTRRRLLSFILEMGLKQGKKVGFDTMIENPFTHQEIGDIIGASRQTVTTTFNELKEQNIIYYNRKKILIRDLKKLKQMFSK